MSQSLVTSAGATIGHLLVMKGSFFFNKTLESPSGEWIEHVWTLFWVKQGIWNFGSFGGEPPIRRIRFVLLDPTVVRDDQAFPPWFVVVGVAPSLPFCSSLQQANKAIIVASTKRPAYARKNLQLVQVKSIRMLSSLIEYNAVSMMVVCNLRHLSFVAWWIQDPYFFLSFLVWIPSCVLIMWQRNQRRWFQFHVDWCVETVFLGTGPFWWWVRCWSICGQTP